MITTVRLNDQACEHELMALRNRLVREGKIDRPYFHACEDSTEVQKQVFDVLIRHDMRVDATIYEKRKAHPKTRPDYLTFFQFAWHYHLQGMITAMAADADEVFLVAASLENNQKQQARIKTAVRQVCEARLEDIPLTACCWQSSNCLGLQIADYCSWALQRQWEGGKDWPLTLIADKVKSQFDLFRTGTRSFY